jgi:hypothetical protein
VLDVFSYYLSSSLCDFNDGFSYIDKSRRKMEMKTKLQKIIEGLKWSGLAIILIAIWVKSIILDFVATLFLIYFAVEIILSMLKDVSS